MKRAEQSRFKSEIKALQEQTYLYAADKQLEYAETHLDFGNVNNINAGYENLIAISSKNNGLYNFSGEIDEMGTSPVIETVLSDIKEPYKSKVIVYEGEFYYIYDPKQQGDREKAKWCFEVNVKVWGYEDYNDFENNAPDEESYLHDGSYKEIKGLYMCVPDLGGFKQLHTRYVMWADNGAGSQDIGTWTVKTPPENWYDYKNKQWANVLVENEGKETWLVWIPRYMYKIGGQDIEGNTIPAETVDIRFVDKNNDYKHSGDESKNKAEADLLAAGYKLAEAFTWGDNETDVSQNNQLAGFWASKYEANDASTVATMKILMTMEVAPGMNRITIRNIAFPSTGGLNSSQVATYEYYLNAKLKETVTTASLRAEQA